VDMLSLEEADRAIERSHAASSAWRAVTPADRARLLRRFSETVDSHLEELAQLEVANSGHTISNARWEAGNVRDVLAYYSGAPERHAGKQIPVAAASISPSTNRLVSWASSHPGTFRCPSPVGGSVRRWPPETPWS